MTLHKATNVRVIELDMHPLAKILLDITQNPAGRLLLQELCCHVTFPAGQLSVTDLLPCLPPFCLILFIQRQLKSRFFSLFITMVEQQILMDETRQRFTCTHVYVQPVQPCKQEGIY